MNEGEYLDLCNNLKDIFDQKEKQRIEYIKKYNNLYKVVCIIYGLIRTYQEMGDSLEYQHLIDEIRGICSEELFKHLEKIDEDFDD